MLHHLSFAVRNPLHVAEVVAELWQGKVIPFPWHSDSFVALSFDPYGSAIEFFPKGTVLQPRSDDQPVQFSHADLTAANYSATHVNLAVPTSEAQIYAIAQREGWRAVRCNREGLFDLIEFWIENEIMLELLPPNLVEQYLTLVQPDNLKALFKLDATSP
ncbi:hypothetical protein [Myxacorys almedinensis]|uniref:Uncharacterized protein n=1 Tax=Myxacorys almedinensis A TaxID=2690445 RepID=A0A8J8CPG8_9CYAN|nr:hypothetical protein [Myxacorys almedinensis]NDJ19457.1 hypothetical protein [Myxacorys almedinensis A]